MHVLRLATFVGGVKTNQNGYGPIAYCLQDQLDELAQCKLVPKRAGYLS